MRDLSIVDNGAVLIEDGVVTNIGPARRVENLAPARSAEEVDASGCVVLPGFVDSHTHLVHGPARLADYEARIAGRSYAEIAQSGGGILSTMRAVRSATPARLEAQAQAVLNRMAECGTTTVEAKSGYGLDVGSEMKCLRVAADLDGHPLEIVPTFLGPHATPPEYAGDSDAFINELVSEALPLVARKKLAVFADAYCDSGAFSTAQTRRFLMTAREYGLGARLHGAQFVDLGAARLAIELNAHSVDHLEALGASEIAILASSRVVATLLPASVFHLGLDAYAPARALIDAGAAVALATDYNPGSSPTWNMQMVLTLACGRMRMTVEEAISAATVNGAHALGLGGRLGTIEAGRQADLTVFGVSDYREIPYHFGVNHAIYTVKRGRVVARGKGTVTQ